MSFISKIPVLNKFSENYTTKVGLWRRRGDSFQFELHDAVRYRYEGRPNAHVLDSGEEIPAVPLNHIYTMSDGTPYLEVVEVEDGQYAPRDKLVNSDEYDADDFKASVDEFEGDLVPLKAHVDSKQLDDTVIQNKDTRLNFWLDHLKESNEKYNTGGLIREHMNIILIVVTALAIGIILYTSPMASDAFIQILQDLTTAMETLNGNLEIFIEQNPGMAGE